MKQTLINGHKFFSDPQTGKWYAYDDDLEGKIYLGTAGDIDYCTGAPVRSFEIVKDYLDWINQDDDSRRYADY